MSKDNCPYSQKDDCPYSQKDNCLLSQKDNRLLSQKDDCLLSQKDDCLYSQKDNCLSVMGKEMCKDLWESDCYFEYIITPHMKNLLLVDRRVILGYVEDQLLENSSCRYKLYHFWKSVTPNFKSILNRQLTGSNITYNPNVKRVNP